MAEYDYYRQCWVDDPDDARRLRLEHLKQERELVDGPNGPQYLHATGSTETVTERLELIDAEIRAIV